MPIHLKKEGITYFGVRTFARKPFHTKKGRTETAGVWCVFLCYRKQVPGAREKKTVDVENIRVFKQTNIEIIDKTCTLVEVTDTVSVTFKS